MAPTVAVHASLAPISTVTTSWAAFLPDRDAHLPVEIDSLGADLGVVVLVAREAAVRRRRPARMQAVAKRDRFRWSTDRRAVAEEAAGVKTARDRIAGGGERHHLDGRATLVSIVKAPTTSAASNATPRRAGRGASLAKRAGDTDSPSSHLTVMQFSGSRIYQADSTHRREVTPDRVNAIGCPQIGKGSRSACGKHKKNEPRKRS